MNKKFRQLKQTVREMQLTAKEKTDLGRNLSGFIASHPVRIAPHVRQGYQSWLFLITKPMFAAIVLSIAMVMGGGVSYAAENSLPGDTLYPVKIHVNEEVRSALAVSTKKQAEVETVLAERRLEEAEQLAARGRLNATVEAALENKFRQHAENARGHIDQLEAEDSEDIDARFEAMVRAHNQAVMSLNAVEKKEGQLDRIQMHVNRILKQADDNRHEAELRLDVRAKTEQRTAAEGKQRVALKSIEDTENYITRLKNKANGASVVRSETKLTEAKQAYARGEAAMKMETYNDAFVAFSTAHRFAAEAKALVKVEVDLRGQVTLPIVTTTANIWDVVSSTIGKEMHQIENRKEQKEKKEVKQEEREDRQGEQDDDRDDDEEEDQDGRNRIQPIEVRSDATIRTRIGL